MVIDLPGVSGYVKRKRSVRQVSAALQYRNGISGLFFCLSAIHDSNKVIKTLKQDFVAIALYVIVICVAVLLWSFQFYLYVVPIAFISTAVGWMYFSYRNRWWKKENEKDGEDGA
jgi:hypothetical protein